MALADFQDALARMVMEPWMAERVRAEGVGVLEGYDLDPRERRRLVNIARQETGLRMGTHFHRSFRLTKIAYTLPGTKAALGEKFGAVILEYWREHPDVHEYFDVEARRFGNWVASRTQSDSLRAIVERELLELEFRVNLPLAYAAEVR
jgi:hypothetical protein